MRRLPQLERAPATLETGLETYYAVDHLKRLAVLLGSARPKTRADLVNAIVAEVEGSRLPELVGRLNPLQRAALAEAVHGDGRHHADRFHARHGADPDWGKALDRRDAKPSLLCLFFHGPLASGPLYVPVSLRRRLAQLVEPPAAPVIARLEGPPTRFGIPELPWRIERGAPAVREHVAVTVRDMEPAALHDVQAVLGLVDAGRLAVTEKTRRPVSAAIRGVAAVLHGGDFYETPDEPGTNRKAGRSGLRRRSVSSAEHEGMPGAIRAFAWPMLLQAAKLARPWGSKLRLTPAGRAALGEPPHRVVRMLWDRWQDTDIVDEMSRVEAIRGQSGHGRRGMTDPAGRREAVAAALAACPPGAWITVNEFFRFMRAAGHAFRVTNDHWSLYIAERQYGSLGYAGYGGWEILEARFALVLLFEYAATLGMIDVAYVPPSGARPDYMHQWGTDDLAFLSRYDGLVAFRLTPLGAYALDIVDSYEAGAGGDGERASLRVLPNLEIAALEGDVVAAADRLVLDRLAVRVSERVWQLDRDRLLAAIEDGHEPALLRKLLAARTAPPLPETAERFLADIAARGERIHDAGAARLIDCGDAALAREISRAPATRKFCMLAGDRFVAVPTAQIDRFRAALRKKGYVLPAIS